MHRNSVGIGSHYTVAYRAFSIGIFYRRERNIDQWIHFIPEKLEPGCLCLYDQARGNNLPGIWNIYSGHDSRYSLQCVDHYYAGLSNVSKEL